MSERRKDYRIMGRAQILMKILKDEPTEQESARGYFMSKELMEFAAAYENLSNRFSEALAHLGTIDSALSDALSLLEKKQDLIEQQFFLSETGDSGAPIDVDLSLSASGACFNSDHELKPNSYLSIRLALLPGHSLVYTFAKCIRCHSIENGEYEVAVNFFNLGSQEGQMLRRHIMQAERELLRREASVTLIRD